MSWRGPALAVVDSSLQVRFEVAQFFVYHVDRVCAQAHAKRTRTDTGTPRARQSAPLAPPSPSRSAGRPSRRAGARAGPPRRTSRVFQVEERAVAGAVEGAVCELVISSGELVVEDLVQPPHGRGVLLAAEREATAARQLRCAARVSPRARARSRGAQAPHRGLAGRPRGAPACSMQRAACSVQRAA